VGAFCPAEIRLLRYGFVPAAFNSHVMLRKLCLPEVQKVPTITMELALK